MYASSLTYARKLSAWQAKARTATDAAATSNQRSVSDARARVSAATAAARSLSDLCPPRDVLDLGVLLDTVPPALPAEAALLEAAEGRVDHVDAVVDPDDAGTDALGERQRFRGIAGVDGTA